MVRTEWADAEREPFIRNDSVRRDSNQTHAPFAILNPTTAVFEPVNEQNTSKVVTYKWTSRNNRKGRHAIVVNTQSQNVSKIHLPEETTKAKVVLNGIWRMLTYYPVWDVSFNVAFIFTLGSIIWVINAFFALLPFTNPSLDFNGETLYGGGITAFIGATIFEIGSVLLMLEAVNENRSGCFGWALEDLFHPPADGQTYFHHSRLDTNCTHHHQNKLNLVGKPSSNAEAPKSPTQTWQWWPSVHELKSHYIHELGFLACCAQMFGATIFWISGFTALPGIFNVLSPGLTNGIYWVPQVIGGSGFIVSGTLFMLETQKHWWQPAFRVLGWWIGLWNLIGGIGFTLCPCFGFSSAEWSQEQAAASTFWGSWAFLIGSVIQWYESLEKFPVEKV